MINIIGIAIISSVLYLLVKKYSPEYGILVEIAAVIFVIWAVFPYLCDVIDFYTDSVKKTGIDNDYVLLLLKVAGIATITQFSADICNDSGENALASKIEFAGKTLIIAVSLPMVKALLIFATGLIK